MDVLSTKYLAQEVANFITADSGEKCEVNSYEANSFELDLGGELFAGGSYYIKDDVLILASVTPQVELGHVNDRESIEKNIKQYYLKPFIKD
jgi:hypothetical protein